MSAISPFLNKTVQLGAPITAGALGATAALTNPNEYGTGYDPSLLGAGINLGVAGLGAAGGLQNLKNLGTAKNLSSVAAKGSRFLPVVGALANSGINTYLANKAHEEGDTLGKWMYGAGAGISAAGAIPALAPVAYPLSFVPDAVMGARDIYRNYKNTRTGNTLGEAGKKLSTTPVSPTPTEQPIDRLQQPLGNAPNPAARNMQTPNPVQPQPQNNPSGLSKGGELFKSAYTSSFKQDLENPEAGLSSDLYQSVAPILAPTENPNRSPQEMERIRKLQESVRKGMVGMEYLTGLKKNVGQTYYDEHPAEAVTTDVLSKAPWLGAAAGLGGMLTNVYRQWSNFKKTQPASMSREGNPNVDRTNSAFLLDPAGRSNPDISRIFGDFTSNIEKRLAILDRLNGTPSGGFLDAWNRSKGSFSADKIQKEILNQAKASEAMTALRPYVDVHQSLQSAASKGGLKPMLGGSPLSEVAEIFEKSKITGANPKFDESLVKDIVREYRKGGDFSAAHDPKGKAFIDKTLRDLRDRDLQGSSLRKFWSKQKSPLLLGGAIAAGGYGLYKLIKAWQEKAYSEKQRKEWTKTLLRSRGEHEAADKLV
jgi:hypothetical protein